MLCASQSDAEYFEALGARVVLAPNGVDEELLAIRTSCRQARSSVLFFGRLDHAPNAIGLERLRFSWPRVVATRPDASLRIVGGGLDTGSSA